MKHFNKIVMIQKFFGEASQDVADLTFALVKAEMAARKRAEAPEKTATGKRRGRPPKVRLVEGEGYPTPRVIDE